MGLVYTVTEEGRVISNVGALTSSSKGDLSTGSQTVLGNSETYIANGNLVAGQPVEFDYTGSNVTVKTITSISSSTYVAGIVANDVSNGDPAIVVNSGFVTGRRTTINLPSSETYAMPNSSTAPTTNIRALTNETTFTDSGGAGDYPNSQIHWVTFDAGDGYTQKMTPNSFGFEGSNTRIYDKLIIQVSTDDQTYTNWSPGNNWSWSQNMADSTPPYSGANGGDGFAQGSTTAFDDTGNSPGFCFPSTQARAQTLNGGESVIGQPVSIPYRYVRYWFYADSSIDSVGWNLTLEPNTPYTTSAAPVPLGASLYLDNSDFTKLSTDNTSGVFIGFNANADVADNSIFLRVAL